MNDAIPQACDCPAAPLTVREQIHQQVDLLTDFCQTCETSFADFEKSLQIKMRVLGCLLVSLFLLSRHLRLDRQSWLPGYRLVDASVPRLLDTIFGTVRYGRAYLARLGGKGGFHPLDAVLGLTRDGFTPALISLVCRLSTRLSYKVSELVCKAFLGWSPSTESMEHLVLGLGRCASAYMASSPEFADVEGEVLVIEVDGKAVPTARAEELRKRRQSRRHGTECGCGCQRHRGKARRRGRGPKKRRKKGDKSKNGRSATLVVMYTLHRGDDGLLHGPINKRVWGSFASRKVMLQWARAEATRRGFAPDTSQRIEIMLDGEKCLEMRLRQLFPNAEITLDIRHVEERLWRAGQAFHAEGSTALKEWVEELRTLLYTKGGAALVERLCSHLGRIAPCGPGTKQKRAVLQGLITYLEPRIAMMDYPRLIAEDLVIATGVVEGAARYVVGERMDCSGMRWVEGKAEAILRLRCLEVNGLWDKFFDWCQEHWKEKLQKGKKILIRTEKAIDLSEKKRQRKKKRKPRKEKPLKLQGAA